MTRSTTHRRPRRVALRSLLLGGTCLLASAALAWTPTVVSGWNQASAEATLWQLLNGARVNNGMAPLQQHGTLVSLARWRSRDMLDRNYFSHTIAGSSCQVYCWYDSNGLSYHWGGENIHWNSGQTDDYSPIHAHEKFMASAGHRANVLNANFTHGGVGAAASDNIDFQGSVRSPRMYTQLFMHATGAAPAPPAPGGGAQPAPQAPAQPAAPTPPPEPTALTIRISAPAAPTSAAGLDGVAVLLTAPRSVDGTTAPAAGAAAQKDTAFEATKRADANDAMRVEAAPASEHGFFDGVLDGFVAFLFG